MERKKQKGGQLIKTVLVMYIVTGLLLIALAFLVSKVDKEEMVAKVGVIVIYVISCMLGGYIVGKMKKTRKFLWGLLAGTAYVVILLAIGLVICRGALPEPMTSITTIAVCMGAGMLGGMIS